MIVVAGEGGGEVGQGLATEIPDAEEPQHDEEQHEKVGPGGVPREVADHRTADLPVASAMSD